MNIYAALAQQTVESRSPLLSRTAAHLYSQKVSSFISWDSTSGWRSSFSFTAGEVEDSFLLGCLFVCLLATQLMI